jgi:hypothetical protein
MVVPGAIGQAVSVPQAAEPLPPATKLEAFKPSVGSVVTLGYDELGRVGTVAVNVRQIKDAKGGDVRGLVVEVTESQYRVQRSFVDADEIPELVKGLDALLQVRDNPTPFRQFEVQYRTRGDLQLIAFNNARGVLSYSVKAGRGVEATTFINETGMQQLRAIFDSALQKLNSLPAK